MSAEHGVTRRQLFGLMAGGIAATALAKTAAARPSTGTYSPADILANSLTIEQHTTGLHVAEFETMRPCPRLGDRVEIHWKEYGIVFAGTVEHTTERSANHPKHPLRTRVRASNRHSLPPLTWSDAYGL